MKFITQIDDLQRQINQLKAEGHSIGFVPTMGFLHEGHGKLITEAKNNNDIVVISIFVNPLQFGPNEDFEHYPRDIERDQQFAEAHGVDLLFNPSVQEIYPDGLSIKMSVHKRTNVLCGRARPGHFDGVVTVLTKLFHLVQPNRVYFGMKDAQQVAVVDGLVKDLNFPLEVVAVETVRETDGLAKSSRNVRLSPLERTEAPFIYKTLLEVKKWVQEGKMSKQEITDKARQLLQKRISASIDYIVILSYPELENKDEFQGKMIVAVAVIYEKVRLIDNIVVKAER